MREIEGENGNGHLMENFCTLLYDYIESTRTLVVFLDCGYNSVVHLCLSPESWLMLSVRISEAKQEQSREYYYGGTSGSPAGSYAVGPNKKLTIIKL